MTTKKLTKLLALYLPYILLGLVATNFGEAWRLAEGKELGDKIMSMMGTVPLAFANPLPSLHPLDILVGLCCGAGLRLAVYLRGKNAKKYRHGMEYGSARWGTAKDIEPFMAPKFFDNIILTKTEHLMMSNRPPDPKNARNKNVLVVGGSGSGKTRFWLKPNLLQCHSSYVVTDPKSTILLECGNAMLKNGYKIRILNTINFKKSMHYNPFAYVHSEKDILKLVTTLMTNTKGEGSGGDPFWEKSERLLLTALIAYLHYEAPVEEQNFATLLEMLSTMQVMEDDEEYQNPVDLLFEELAKKKPNSFAGRQYKLYKLAAGKTAKSILISCGARLAPFDIQELRDLTMYDELQLDTLGDKKTALFLIMSDTDSTFNFLISMVYTQLFNLLCDKADDVYGGKLPVHVRCLIDECANIGQIPKLEKLMATIRSRCCAYSLAPVAEEVCAAYLKKHFPKEPEAARYAALFGGKIGSAKRCLEDAAWRTLLLDALKLAGLAEKQDVYGALALLSKYEKDRAGTQALLGLLLNVCSASLRGSEAAQSPVSPARAARCAGEAGKTARLLAGNVSGKLALTCLAARLTA